MVKYRRGPGEAAREAKVSLLELALELRSWPATTSQSPYRGESAHRASEIFGLLAHQGVRRDLDGSGTLREIASGTTIPAYRRLRGEDEPAH